MDVIGLENLREAEIHGAPPIEDVEPFLVTEYGRTFVGLPCYQLRLKSPIGCLQYVVEGSGVIICGDKIFTVHAGDAFLLPEGYDQIYYSNPDNCFERVWINFKGELAERLLEVYKIKEQIVFRQTNALPLLTTLQEVCQENTEPTAYKRETAKAFFSLVQFLAEHKKETAEPAEAIEQIRLYIDCHITENLKLSQIAKQFYFTEEHVIRVFKKTYSITPHQYVLQSKIRIAMVMLRTTKNSIEEISATLNFSDPRHFSYQFKKHTGIRPLAYRQSFK